MRSPAAVFVLVLAWVLQCSCGTALALELSPDGQGYYSVPVRSLQQLRFRTTFKQQFDFSCGSAAIATLLTYHYEYPVDEAAALGGMFENGDQAKIRREGFSMLDMKRFLAASGFDADGFKVDLSQLATAGVPAIALIERDGYQHFVVIKGIAGDRVLIGDPSRGTRSVERRNFEAAHNGILLVIRNRADVARRHFNDAREWLSAGALPLEMALQRPGLEWRVPAVTR